MPPPRAGHAGRRVLPPLGLLALAVVVGLLSAACSQGGQPFDPDGPCTVDGRMAGAYPELEALVPERFDERAPDRLDSGRSCTDVALGQLAEAGFDEVRFAGGLWGLGSESGATLAVFSAEGLTAELLGDFYHAGADAARKTEDVVGGPTIVAGRPAYRLDLTNDGYLQTVVTWAAPDGASVRVVLVSSAARDVPDETTHDATVEAAIEAFEGASSG